MLFVAAGVGTIALFAGEPGQSHHSGGFSQTQYQVADFLGQGTEGRFCNLVKDDAALEAWLAVGPAQKEIDLKQTLLPEVGRKIAKIFKNQFDLILPSNSHEQERVVVQMRLQNARAIDVFNAMNLYFEAQKLPARWKLTLNGERPTAILALDDLPSGAATVEKIADTVFPIPDILCEGNPAVRLPAAEHLEDSLAAALNDVRKPGRAKANSPGGPVVKVHTQSGIVVLNGTGEETELVRSTLQALKDSAQERQDVAKEKILRVKEEGAQADAAFLRKD